MTPLNIPREILQRSFEGGTQMWHLKSWVWKLADGWLTCRLTHNSDQFPLKSVFISKLWPKSHFSIFLGRDDSDLQDKDVIKFLIRRYKCIIVYRYVYRSRILQIALIEVSVLVPPRKPFYNLDFCTVVGLDQSDGPLKKGSPSPSWYLPLSRPWKSLELECMNMRD